MRLVAAPGQTCAAIEMAAPLTIVASPCALRLGAVVSVNLRIMPIIYSWLFVSPTLGLYIGHTRKRSADICELFTLVVASYMDMGLIGQMLRVHLVVGLSVMETYRVCSRVSLRRHAHTI